MGLERLRSFVPTKRLDIEKWCNNKGKIGLMHQRKDTVEKGFSAVPSGVNRRGRAEAGSPAHKPQCGRGYKHPAPVV